MALSTALIESITQAHSRGLCDQDIARYADISISSVKRHRNTLGLETRSITARRGSYGEKLFAGLAEDRGLEVAWRSRENASYDLLVEGQRVDVKTAMREMGGVWRFRLSEVRSSFMGQYQYRKDYARDADVLALVCLFPDAWEPRLYLLGSSQLPREVRIRVGGSFEPFHDAWEIFEDMKTPESPNGEIILRA